jgi:hypothetical protein
MEGGGEGIGSRGRGGGGRGEALEKQRGQEGNHFFKCLIPPPDLE